MSALTERVHTEAVEFVNKYFLLSDESRVLLIELAMNKGAMIALEENKKEMHKVFDGWGDKRKQR